MPDKATFSNVKNITIHKNKSNMGPCEPSICISPKNKDIIVAGSVLDNVYISTDAGLTWQNSKLKSSFGVFGDPVLRINNDGHIFYAHLSNPSGKAYQSDDFLDRIVVQKSIDNGKTFSDGTFPAVNHMKDHDKHWLGLDPLGNTILMTWTEFDKYGSTESKDKSRILFSKSTDAGKTWTPAIVINELEGDCIDDDKTTEGAIPAVDLDGSYYVVWSYNEKIYFDKSMDGGKTWMSKDQVIAEQPGGWSFDIPGITRCNGMPMLKIDYSNGPGKGNLYVLWSDQRNGTNDTDVWLIKSSDKGKTWSDPKRVNDDAKGKQQFLSWMDIDPSTGYVYTVFYDRRNHADNHTDVYLAYSTDQGKSFKNEKISDTSFKPTSDVFFGDYNDISAYGGRVRPIWTRLDNEGLSVMTAIIDVK